MNGHSLATFLIVLQNLDILRYQMSIASDVIGGEGLVSFERTMRPNEGWVAAILLFPALMATVLTFTMSAVVILSLLGMTLYLLRTSKQEV